MQNQQPLFDQLVAEIQSAYVSLGHTLGWRFLNVSRRVLDQTVRIAFITINPGGDEIPYPQDHPPASCEDGSSFLVERWKGSLPGQSKLQIQVRELFKGLATQLQYPGSWQQLLEESLVSQFVPFRSPSIDDLPRQAESFDFARNLWRRILPVTRPRLTICLGREVQQELKPLLSECLDTIHTSGQAYPTGWGKYKAEITTFDTGAGRVRLLYLPHLSRYTLFTSPKCGSFMHAILQSAARCLG